MANRRLLGVFGVLICLIVACGATTYMVGDTAGWDISSDLDSWAAEKRFVVGDVLGKVYSSCFFFIECLMVYKSCTCSFDYQIVNISKWYAKASVPLTTYNSILNSPLWFEDLLNF